MDTGLRILHGRYNSFFKISCFGLLGIILLSFVLSYIPKEINLTYTGIQYSKNNTTYAKKITVIVKGKLYKHWFSDSKFVGSIILNNYKITKNKPMFPINFLRIRNGLGILAYDTTTYKKIRIQENSSRYALVVDKPNAKILGNIIIKGNFKTIAIAMFLPDDSMRDMKEIQYISAPAKSRNDAVKYKIEL